MKLDTRLALLVVLALSSGAALAQHSKRQLAARRDDAFAPVFIVSSQATWQHAVQPIAANGSVRRDSVGNRLVLSEIKANQLSEISQAVHRKENRCGGFFAFGTRRDAEAFIASDRTAQAITRTPLVAYTIDNAATVNPWLGAVQEAGIKTTITSLSTNYVNRYYSAPTGKTSAEWIRSTWMGLANGRSDVSSELFTGCTTCSTQPSVILTVQGVELPNEIVVLGAHLDSINVNDRNNPSQSAPGADDDGSGIATLTEVIRVAMANGWKPRRTVKFMGYAAEEVGLRGSNAIATSFKNAGQNVVGVMQLDMTNYRTSGAVDMQLVTDNSSTQMQQFLTDLFDTYLAPTSMTRGSYTCGYACSDHASWTSAGYPSAMMFEGGNTSSGYNPYIHSANDTLVNTGNSVTPTVPFAKLGLAFLGELAKTSGGAPGGGNVLSNGVPVSSIGGAAGSRQYWTMTVPAGATGLKFVTSGGSGDADLYAKFGTQPTSTSFDCKSEGGTTAETCNIATAQAGTYHVLVSGYSTYSGMSLTGSYTIGGGGGGTQTYSNQTATNIPDVSTITSTINVSARSGNAPTNASISVNITHTFRGDLKIDLLAPDGSVYALKTTSTNDSADNVVATYSKNLSTELLNGAWKLRVQDAYSGDTGKLNSWSITF